ANVLSHLSRTDNPHSVTKAQVGLGSVPNTDFTNAVALNTAKVTNATHTGDVSGSSVLTIGTNKVTNEMLDKMPPKTYKGNTSITTEDADNVTVSVLREDLAIDQVNNTSDINKPLSTASINALATKQPKDLVYP